jgi:acyl dehydratase
MREMIVHLPLSGLGGRLGDEVGVSDWLAISQARIDQFADATGDHQWIHQDASRATTESPYGATIAHGFLTLSLVTTLLQETIAVDGAGMVINYGCDRVRFVSAVPVNSRIRGRFALKAVEDTGDGLQVTWGVTIERDGGDKPAVVLDWKIRYYRPATGSQP